MSILDIFTEMSAHMLEGIMFHESFMKAYMFLNLPGYAACHEYHYLSETAGHIRLNKYVSNHLNSLIMPIPDSTKQVIPSSWKGSSRSDISSQVRLEAIKSAFHEWVIWEEDTVRFYERLYREALEISEIPASEFIKSYILDAEEEIAYARNDLISKEAIDFDIVSIFEEQKFLEGKFRKRIRKIGDEINEDE